jgi:hypothetical protein
MEAYFDDKTNVLNACIRISHDNSAAYSIKTTFGLRGRKITVLRDENPTMGSPSVVGIIHWKEGAFEISGHKKKVAEIKRTEGGFLKKCVQILSFCLTDLNELWQVPLLEVVHR